MNKQNPEILQDSLAYLIGPMDAAKDHGSVWRKEIVDLCRNKNLKIRFLDPTRKITGLQEEVGKEKEKIIDCKNAGRWEELSAVMKRIVREDHRCVDLSDFVIFYIDPDVYTCGSFFEFRAALSQKKPYFIVCPKGKKRVPSWLFGIARHEYFFESIEEVVNELVLLNDGSKEINDRWVLFRKQLQNL